MGGLSAIAISNPHFYGAQPYRARADTPFRFCPSPTLAVFRQERAGICASLLTKPGKRTRTLFSSYSNPIFRWSGVACKARELLPSSCSLVDNVLLNVRCRIAQKRVPAVASLDSLTLALILLVT